MPSRSGAGSQSGGQGLVGVKRNLKGIGVKDARGKLTGFQGEMIKAHERMAKNVQNAIVRELKANLGGRPQVNRRGQGKNALINAVKAEDNRSWGYQGFKVMKPEYLDSLPAVGQYWRLQNEGTSQFMGRQFRGYFLTPGVGTSGPKREHYGRDALMIIRGSAGGLNQEGKFAGGAYGQHRGQSGTRAIPSQSLFASSRSRSGKENYPIITIRRSIRPKQYIQKGFASWLDSKDEKRQTRRAAKDAGWKMRGDHVLVPPKLNR